MDTISETSHFSPAVRRWLAKFAAEPVVALDKLLCGRVSLGPYQRAQRAEALAQILTGDAQRARGDEAMREWLDFYLHNPPPADLLNQRFADALCQALYAVALLPLPRSAQWCLEHHGPLRRLCRGHYFGTSLDPEGELLTTLAGYQPDRRLQTLWLSLAGFKSATQPHYAPVGLTGLRLMPADDQGTPERGVPKALLRGLLDYGEALARRGDKDNNTLWLRQVDMLAAVYPQSPQRWGQRFREVILASRQPGRVVRNWLDQRYPGALRPADNNTRNQTLLPTEDERKGFVRKLKQLPLERIRQELEVFLDRYRGYTWETGDSYYLTRTFSQMGNLLLNKDPRWARELAHEAARWQPGNPYLWSLLARALEAEGDWRRAEAVLWHARRRFPYDAHSHNQLGHALVLHGAAELGEAVYREAIRLFPADPVCRNDLAHTLRLSGQADKAVAVYQETCELFSRDCVATCGLADTLIDLQRLDDAEEVLDWAEAIAASDKDEHITNAIRKRLQRASAGEAVQPKTPPQPKEEISTGELADLADITGVAFGEAPDLGQATLWRQRGEPQRAAAALRNLDEGSSEHLIESALLRGQEDGWSAALGYFDAHGKRYEGDGVVRFHHLRARARCDEAVDWGGEKQRYPEFYPLFVTEEGGAPPRFEFDPKDPELSDSQRLNWWFSDTLSREAGLRDRAEEEWLTAYHQW